jgi:hypothetical protein
MDAFVPVDEESRLLGGGGATTTSTKTNRKKKERLQLLGSFVGGLVVATFAASFWSNSARGYPGVPIELDDAKTLQDSTTGPWMIDFHHRKSKSNSHHKSIPTPTTPYKKFQTLGFQLYTGGAPVEIPGQYGVKNDECLGLNSYGQAAELDPDDIARNVTNTQWQCYLGHENPVDDVKHRLKVMTDAVEAAHKVASKDESVLKIFVAPEFFWRGKDGAYVFWNASDVGSDAYNKREQLWIDADGDDYDPDCQEVCHVLRGLEALVANEKYKDWLFLFGTVIVSESLPQEDRFDYVFYNFAPLYRGYGKYACTEHEELP